MLPLQKDEEMKYTPTTAPAAELLGLVQAYAAAHEKARAAELALADWALAFVNAKVGDIIETGQSYGNAGYIGNFTMRDSFSGWKGNRRRMRIEQVCAVTNCPMTHHPRLQVQLKGIPLKDDNQPFKGARCSITVDLLEQALSFDFKSESGYPGYLKDALSRYIDCQAGADKNNAARTPEEK